MAELTIEQVLEFLNKADSGTIQKVFSTVAEGSESARQAMTNWAGAVSNTSGLLEKLKDIVGDAQDKLSALAGVNFGQFIGGLSSANKEVVSMIAQTGLLLTAISGIKPDAFNAIGEAANGATGDMSRVFDNLNRISQLDPTKFSTKLLKGMAALHELGEPARRFEVGLMAMSARSGEFGDLISEVGNDLEGMENKLVSFTNLTYRVAQVSGLTTTQVAKYASELNKIPGALSTTIETTADGAEHMHMLDAAIKVAAGTGQDFSSVVEQMNAVYQEFGTTGKGALEFVSRLATASQSLKMPLDMVKSYVTGASQSFRFFGDNSQAAISILGKFGPALAESGLGPKAIAELTQNVTRNISEMNLAQRAFVSGTSGGPGGLQGAYQIELLKRQGKVDEVQKMVEDSLRQQFGGRIVTLEEAGKDQGLAAQFTKQVQLLTQGPSKMASSEGEAYAILDAMSKGTRAQSRPQIATKEESLTKALDIGNNFQERNYSQLTAMSNTLDLQAQYGSIVASNTTRMLGGRGFHETNIDKNRLKQGDQAANIQMLKGSNINAQELDLSEAIIGHLSDVGSADDMAQSMNNTISDATKRLKSKTKELEGSAVYPVSRVEKAMSAGTDTTTTRGAQGTKMAEPQTLTVTNVNTCAICQKQEMTKTAEIVFDGRIEDVKKGEVKHVHTGANVK